jgi:hypothetical protein
MRLTKLGALSVIHKCAVLYKNNLLGKNILFVVSTGNKANYFEALFLAKNYLHFTGVKTELKANLFFDAAFKNKLGEND